MFRSKQPAPIHCHGESALSEVISAAEQLREKVRSINRGKAEKGFPRTGAAMPEDASRAHWRFIARFSVECIYYPGTL